MNLNEIFVLSDVFGPERSSGPCSLPHSPVSNRLVRFVRVVRSAQFNPLASPTESDLIKVNQA